MKGERATIENPSGLVEPDSSKIMLNRDLAGRSAAPYGWYLSDASVIDDIAVFILLENQGHKILIEGWPWLKQRRRKKFLKCTTLT